MIQVAGLSKTFWDNHKRPLTVLSDVNFTVEKNEFVCIVGPSGCGKTVLMDILAGFSKPSSGRVLIDGKGVDGPSPNYVSIFQDYKLLPWRTVRKNIELGFEGREIKLPREEIDRIVSEQIESVGLSGFENYRPFEISGGMKQRVAIARALAVDPDIIFMDEPFGALDSVTKEAMRLKMQQLFSGKKDKTVVFVTHDVDEAVMLGDKIMVMQSSPGRIKTVVNVNLPRPVEKYTKTFDELRDRVLGMIAEGAG